MSNNECPICKSSLGAAGGIIERPGNQHFICPRCGDFYLSKSALATLPHKLDNEDKIAVLSHAIRKMQRENNPPILTDELVDNILQTTKVLTPVEQANNFIRWLGKNISGPGERKDISPVYLQSVMGAKTENGFNWVIIHLYDSGFIIGNVSNTLHTPFYANVTLSFKGWEYYEQLERGAINSRKAFMAMEFNNPELDKIVESFFKPAVEKTGFELQTLNDEKRAGLIDDRIRVEIRASRFIIADLTHDNPGAYWEAGFAEGLGKPVIYTCEKNKFESSKTHFDTNHHLTIRWDKNNPTEAVEDLKATIRATLPAEAKLSDD